MATEERLLELLRQYGDHKFSCEALEVNWRKGPCDCGWQKVQIELGLLVAIDTETRGTEL